MPVITNRNFKRFPVSDAQWQALKALWSVERDGSVEFVDFRQRVLPVRNSTDITLEYRGTWIRITSYGEVV